ncbi:MAG: choice-of-anchor J domain-containing protein [candidate division WOR-3 bacterium]
MCNKKYVALLILVVFVLPLVADVLLDENFDLVTVPNMPTGWVVIDNNSDGKTWTTTTSHPRSIPNCIRYNYSTLNTANDWFYTSGLALQSGITYTLEFYYRGSNPFFTEKLKVYYDNDQSVGGGTQILDLPNITNTIYQQALVDFTVPSSGTYYLGFQCYSAANQWNLRIDDIKVYKQVHDVGVDSILEPDPITYNVSTPITPEVRVRNYGQNTGGEVNVKVYGMILWYGNDSTRTTTPTVVYFDSVLLPRLEICSPEIVQFTPWQPIACYSRFVAWTALANDIDRSNDTSKVDFAVDFRDVAVKSIVIPQDTVLWCTESIPTDTVVNYGHRTESFWVFFKSLNNLSQVEYLDSVYIVDLAAGAKQVVMFKPWHFPVCNHTAISWTKLSGDENPHNDTVVKPYVVKKYDFEVISVYNIPDTAQVCNWYMPKMIIHNNGAHTGPQSAIAHMNIYRNNVLISQFTAPTRLLNPCENDTISFEWHAESACSHTIKAWVELAGDQNHANDTVWKNFVVKYYDAEVVAILNVPDTVTVCNNVTAKVVVHNNGVHIGPQLCWVYFKLYRGVDNGEIDWTLIKQDSMQMTLTPCVYDTAFFTFHADSACWHRIFAKVKCPLDQNPHNDSIYKDFVIRYYDWELIGPITGLPDTMKVCNLYYPTVNVHNNSKHTYPESARVFMKVYRNGQLLPMFSFVEVYLAPCQTIPVQFEWHADSACTHEFVFYVEPYIAGHDANPNNDTLKKTTVVQWFDVGVVSIGGIPDTVQYCNDITPTVTLHNYGIHTGPVNCTLNVVIYRNQNLIPVFSTTIPVNDLRPCVDSVITLDPYHPDTCFHRIVATVNFASDQNSTNNSKEDTFVVRYFDVEAVSIENLPDTVDYCSTINPKIVVHNNGVHVPSQSGWVIYEVQRSHDMINYYPVYVDSQPKTLEYCVMDTVEFSYHPDSACYHKVVATVRFNPDQNPSNNMVSKDFVVRLYDFEIVDVIGVPDTIEQCNYFDVKVKIHNNGVHTGPQPSTIYLQVYREGMPIGVPLQQSMPNLEPCEIDSFTFTIHAEQYCNHTIKTWVSAPIDQNPINDTVWKNYVVSYHDVGVVAISVPDTIDYCTFISPAITIHNFGIHTGSVNGELNVTIYRRYGSEPEVVETTYVVNVENLRPCVDSIITLIPYHPDTCFHRIVATVNFTPDQVSANNTMEDTFIVRYRDVAVGNIWFDPSLPGDTVITCNDVTPKVEVYNNGSHVGPVPCTVRMRIWRYEIKLDSLCSISPDTLKPIVLYDTFVVVVLNPGLNIVDMPQIHFYWYNIFWVGDHHRVEVTVSSPGDQNPTNNYNWKKFIVKGSNNDLQVSYVGLLKNSIQVIPDGESLKVGYAYNPIAVVANTSPTASFRSYYKIVRERDGNIVFSRYLDKTLLPWTYACLYYQSGWVPTDTGWYTVTCWLGFRPGVDVNPVNNSMSKRYYVKSPHASDKAIQAEEVATPKVFAMHQNYPNPFNNLTHIKWQIPVDAHVTLSVYDASGRVVKTLVNEKRAAGYYSTIWDCTDEHNRKVSAGIYFYEMKAGEFSQRYKMVITR